MSAPSSKRLVIYDLLQRVRRYHSPSMASFTWDVTDLVERIQDLRKSGREVSLLAYITKATALTVRAFPRLNTRVFWTLRGPREVTFDEVSCNLVVYRQRPEELLFPVVLRNVDTMSIVEISERIRHYKVAPVDDLDEVKALRKLDKIPRVLTRLHDRKIVSDPDYFIARFGTYGLSAMLHQNSGMTAISTASPSTTFYPLNMQQEPRVVNGAIVPRTVMLFAAAADHQVIDGVGGLSAARKLQDYMERPGELLDER